MQDLPLLHVQHNLKEYMKMEQIMELRTRTTSSTRTSVTRRHSCGLLREDIGHTTTFLWSTTIRPIRLPEDYRTRTTHPPPASRFFTKTVVPAPETSPAFSR